MKRIRILLAFLMLRAGWFSAAAEGQPNIVLILADDLGYDDLACYGHAKFKTPHLDRMAAEGAKLTHFNCPMPFCAATDRWKYMHGFFKSGPSLPR